MAQAGARTEPAAGIVAAFVVEAETVAVGAGIAVPEAGSPGTSVSQHVGRNLIQAFVRSFAEAEIAVEELTGTGAEEEFPGLTAEVSAHSAVAELVGHLQNQTLAVVVVCQK